jgi:hypothetical protein
MVRVVSVTPLEGYVLELHGPVFDRLRTEPELFRAVRVDAALGTIVWPTGADLCPDVLYRGF